MTDSEPPVRTRSGEHPSVIAFRKKMDSIEETTLPAAEELAAQAIALKRRDPRREVDDDEAHDDIVTLPEVPCLPKKQP